MTNLRLIIGVWSLLLIFFAPFSHAKVALFEDKHLILGPFLSALEDPEHQLSITEAHERLTDFVPLHSQEPSLGYTQSSYWLSVEFKTIHKQKILLEIANPRIDWLDVYYYQNNVLLNTFHSGDQIPFSRRLVQHQNFVFPLQVQADATYRLIFKIRTNDNLFLPVRLWTPLAFFKYQVQTSLLYGILYGVLMVMVLVNLLVFATIQDKEYLLLALFLLFFSLALFTLNGLSNRFLWGDWVWWGKQAQTILEAIAIGFGLYFTRSFLQTALFTPIADRLLALMLPVCLATIFLGLTVPYRWSLLIMSTLSLVLPTLTLYTAAVSWRRHYRPARYYLVAWVIFLVGVIAYGLMIHQFLPSNVWTQFGMHAGLLWMSILLTLALSDRLNILKIEKEQAQQATIKQQQITLDYQKKMMRSIARFVPVQFLNLLNKVDITDIHYGDAILKNMIIMFTDIRGFTSLSEQLSPAENFEFLNSYIRYMEPVIVNNQGFVDKFMGDGIMALFPGSTNQAVSAAIEMQNQLEMFNREQTCNGRPAIRIGIGLHRGDVMLGTLGSDERLETTVIGDSVNLSSRLEHLTKERQVQIIISQAVFETLENPHPFNIQKLEDAKVRGKSKSIKIYQVIVSKSNDSQYNSPGSGNGFND
jgi:class 3 adenylate cyclase